MGAAPGWWLLGLFVGLRRRRSRRHPAARLLPPVLLLLALAVALAVGGCSEEEVTLSQLNILYSPEGKGDHGVNDAVYLAALDARERHGLTLVEMSPGDEDTLQSAFFGHMVPIEEPAAELTLVVSERYAASISLLGCNLAGRQVLVIDAAPPRECAQGALPGVTYRVFAAAFQAAIAAAAAIEGDKVLILAGAIDSQGSEAVAGFQAGAEQANIDVRVEVLAKQTDNDANQVVAYESAAQAYDSRGEQAIFVVGLPAGGVLRAAKERADKFVLGFAADVARSGRAVVIGSVLKRVTTSVTQFIDDTRDGTVADDFTMENVASAGVEFELNAAFVTTLRAAVDDARRDAMDAEDAYWQAKE